MIDFDKRGDRVFSFFVELVKLLCLFIKLQRGEGREIGTERKRERESREEGEGR